MIFGRTYIGRSNRSGAGFVARRGVLGAVAAIVAASVVWLSAAPVSASSFTSAPPRLYMAPAGSSIPDSIAEFVGLPIGTLVFDGADDLISHFDREIVVETFDGNDGCFLEAQPYDIDDCTRIQLTASHGTISMGSVATDLFREDVNGDPDLTDPVYILPGGAVMDSFGPGDDPNAPGHLAIAINGTQDQLNATLENLVFTPDAGYYYTGGVPAGIDMLMASGVDSDEPDRDPPLPDDADDSDSHTIEIIVQDVNGFPTHTGPSAESAQAGVELVLTDEYTVADEDNDEDVDGNQATPPVAEDPLPDGEYAELLLIGWMSCTDPTPIAMDEGFHLRGGAFQASSNTVESLITDLIDPTPLGADEYDAYVTTALAAIEAIEPELLDISLATSNPATYSPAFAGIGTMSVLQYALSEVYFLRSVPEDSCELITVVSDLGNNGLPLLYTEEPEPFGWEVPMLGFDWNVLTVETGELEEITVDFDPGSIVVSEAAGNSDIEAPLHISPSDHPGFTIGWEMNPKTTDPDPIPPGVATPGFGNDFTGGFNNTLTVDPGVTEINLTDLPFANVPRTTVFDDNEMNEGLETFTFDLVLDMDDPPPGYVIVSDIPSRTVEIVDDDHDDWELVTLADRSVVEGDDPDTTTMTFTVELSGPADGDETFSVTTTDDGATSPADFDELNPLVVAFPVGAESATFDVTVNGDVDDEGDETFDVTVTPGATLSGGALTATGTIIDDDQTRTLTVADVMQFEGDGPGTTAMTFTLDLDIPAKGTESVRINTGAPGDTATVVDDYVDVSDEVISFGEGVESVDVEVEIVGDGPVELDEFFTLLLDQETNLLLADESAMGTIRNDDANPTVTIAPGATQDPVTNTAPITFDVVFDTPVTGFAAGDVDLSASTAGGTLVPAVSGASPGAIYTVTVAGMTTSGDVTASIVDGAAQDALLRPSDASTTPATVEWDVDGPTVEVDLAPGQTDPTSLSPVEFEVTFSEPVTGFTESDVSVSGTALATTSVVTNSGDDRTFTVAVSGMSTDGVVQIDVAVAAATDAAGNASAPQTIIDNDVDFVFDSGDVTDPTVTIEQGSLQVDPTAVSPIVFDVEFSEPVTGFATGDVVFTGSTAPGVLVGTVAGGPTVYTVSVSGMTGGGVVTASIPASAAQDAALNPSEASTSDDNQVTYAPLPDDEEDVTDPTVTIEQGSLQVDPTAVSPIVFDVEFSEPVTGFATGDVVFTGSTAPGVLVGTVAGGPTVYTVSVSGMTGGGVVTASIPASAAQDAALNPSEASTSEDNEVTYAPLVDEPLSITVPPNISRNNDPGQAGAVVAFPAASASGGVLPVTVACDHASGEFFPLGTTTVNCTATDSALLQFLDFAELAVSASFTITVIDVEPPVIQDPPDVLRASPDGGPVVVTFSTPTATDNSGVATVTCTRLSGTPYIIGVETVTCTALDAAGNTATSSFTVTVTYVPGAPPTPSGTLPQTGSNTVLTVGLALLMCGVGTVLTRTRRRRPIG